MLWERREWWESSVSGSELVRGHSNLHDLTVVESLEISMRLLTRFYNNSRGGDIITRIHGVSFQLYNNWQRITQINYDKVNQSRRVKPSRAGELGDRVVFRDSHLLDCIHVASCS